MNLVNKDSVQTNPIYIAAQELVIMIQGWKNFDDASIDQNYIFIFNRKQLEGEILLISPFRQQSCDCHANGQPDARPYPIGDINSQASRHFLDSPSKRGVHI